MPNYLDFVVVERYSRSAGGISEFEALVAPIWAQQWASFRTGAHRPRFDPQLHGLAEIRWASFPTLPAAGQPAMRRLGGIRHGREVIGAKGVRVY